MISEQFYAENEDFCIAVKIKKNIVYAYPFDLNAIETGAKVITRTGKTVHSIQIVEDKGAKYITGVLNGQRLKWDNGGRFRSPYINDYRDLYIPERYFDPDWKEKIKMTNAEWQKNFGREHSAKVQYPKFVEYKDVSPNE